LTFHLSRIEEERERQKREERDRESRLWVLAGTLERELVCEIDNKRESESK
jgi:hypothetical protein